MANLLNNAFGEFDYNVLEFFHNLSLTYGGILTPISKILAVIGDLPFLFIGWLGFALFFVLKNKRVGIMMCGSVIIGAILVTIILKNIIYRPRPYLSDVEIYKTWWESFNTKKYLDTSFPSGHVCAAMAGSFALFINSKNKKFTWLMFIYPIIMACSRLYLCVHYPSDVIAGLLVGMIAYLLCIPAEKLLYIILAKFPNFILSKYIFENSKKVI